MDLAVSHQLNFMDCRAIYESVVIVATAEEFMDSKYHKIFTLEIFRL